MKNKIKVLIGSIMCSLIIGVTVQASISWGGAAWPISGGMIGNSHTQNSNDTSYYQVSTDLRFYDANYNTMKYVPTKYSTVNSSGNGYVEIPDTFCNGSVSHVQSYHVWYSRSGDVAEAFYTEY